MMKKIKYYFMQKSRSKKFKQFLALCNESDKILDVGVNSIDYSPSVNFLEKNYPQRKNITALTIEDNYYKFTESYPDVAIYKYDGVRFPFDDKHFDIVYSNAVLEHVGNYGKQKSFLKEKIRTSSKLVFLTTPNRFFPIEIHTNTPFLHFLPKRVFDRYLTLIGKKWATGDYMNCLSFGQLKRLLGEVAPNRRWEIIRNRTFGITSTFTVLIFAN